MMPLRVAGLSGFDVDNTVKELMKAQRVKYDALDQKRQTYEWSRDEYRDTNLKLTDYRNNKLFKFRLEGTFNKKEVTVSGNSEILTAKATSSAGESNLAISVQKLAVAASNFSNSAIAKEEFDPSKPLSEQIPNLLSDAPLTTSYKFKINNSEEITVDTNKDSLNDILSKINQKTNVTAFYDESKKQISFMAKQTGKVNGEDQKGDKIVFEDLNEGNFLSNVLKVATDSGNKSLANDAEVTINGLATTRTSNTFTVNGIEITLKKAGGTEATIEPKTKVDEVVEAIKTFVTEYNDFLKQTQDKLSEKRNRDYLPLTDAQKETMSEKQIEQWEKLAKSGMLRNDSILANMVTDLRFAVTGIVDTGHSTIKSLASIGIDTGDYTEKGKLVIKDETKLRAAIENNLEAVQTLFTQPIGEGEDGAKGGIANRMYARLKDGLDELIEKAGAPNTTSFDQSIVSTRLLEVNKQLDQMDKKLRTMEDNYYKKFAAMEAALNRYNSQSAYLANAFGTGKSQ
ncbi:flagellar filament capping protein FliD [Paenibacillus sp. GCM10012303]|uniref:flagellar filament capping protein FliD n=1 Tax=Paenibacillus sp. GCM10012303 TaxID=3317340 RepID=UPI0036148BEA